MNDESKQFLLSFMVFSKVVEGTVLVPLLCFYSVQFWRALRKPEKAY
jgi:hypothetical protein